MKWNDWPFQSGMDLAANSWLIEHGNPDHQTIKMWDDKKMSRDRYGITESYVFRKKTSPNCFTNLVGGIQILLGMIFVMTTFYGWFLG